MVEINGNHVLQILTLLQKEYPDTKIALNYRNPLELLVATILSAQCTDTRVNRVTTALFKKYQNANDYAQADLTELEKDIKSTGFYRAKARNLKACCRLLVDEFNSEVPKTMDDLLRLPGIGRKTANIILSNAYGIVEGIAVDTHVRRLSLRLGLTKQHNPTKIEQELIQLIPKKQWGTITYLLIDHGRNICKAKKPMCVRCILQKNCPSAFSFQQLVS